MIVDHYSRRAMGIAVFSQQPTSHAIRVFVGRVITDASMRPNRTVPRADCLALTPAFEGLAPEDAALVADEMLWRHLRIGNHPSDKGANSI